jgi:hypothetical protein
MLKLEIRAAPSQLWSPPNLSAKLLLLVRIRINFQGCHDSEKTKIHAEINVNSFLMLGRPLGLFQAAEA